MLEVYFDKATEKQLKRVPKEVKIRLELWVVSIKTIGLKETRKIPGYHDEPLKGKKAGRRSIRLNRQWRAEYRLQKDREGKYIIVLEIHPHDY